MKFSTRGLLIAVLLGALGMTATGKEQPNVLLIMVDDLAPKLGAYGDEIAKTPNMDKLASRGVVFENAYCQVSVCAPSRASILTGLRADTIGCYVNADKFRENVPDAVTLPQAFEHAGYTTVSIGKIYDGRNRDRGGWNEEYFPSTEKWEYVTPEYEKMYKENNARFKAATPREKRNLWRVGPAWEKAGADDDHFDGQVALKAVEVLQRLKDKPFFLAVGFMKPHLPFSAPQQYWDLYNEQQFSLPEQRQAPVDALPISYHEGFELRQYQGIPKKGMLSDELTRTLIHGYYASTSFVDAMVGRVVDELDALGLREKTIIVLMGDHGFHLGDKGIWCKFTTFEPSGRTPLMIIDPRQKETGETALGLVELVDLYPTLCELAGITPPQDLEGTSLVPLLKNLDQEWKTHVFSQVGRGKGWKEYIGTSMRNKNYNYVEWRHRTKGNLRARELYDLKKDPGETQNLIDKDEQRELADQLAQQMEQGWPGALPKTLRN